MYSQEPTPKGTMSVWTEGAWGLGGTIHLGWDGGGEGAQWWNTGGLVPGVLPEGWCSLDCSPGLGWEWEGVEEPKSHTDGSEHALGHGNVAVLESHWP